ncbi:MAG TPA: hypothetical protein VH415_00025 [Nitrososphaeraceae archaeon]|jgi:hypothetical protein
MIFDIELASQCSKFWYEYDKAFNPPMPPSDIATKAQVRQILGPKSIIIPFMDNFNWDTRTLDYDKFKERITELNIKETLSSLGNSQLKFINDLLYRQEIIQTAFEYFGWGVLYDASHDAERTALSAETGKMEIFRIHMIDDISLYGVWHIFIRAINAVILNEKIWFEIDKLVALAYMIHSKVLPIQSFKFIGGPAPENAPAAQKPDWKEIEGVLEMCRKRIQVTGFEQLDSILSNAFRGPLTFI